MKRTILSLGLALFVHSSEASTLPKIWIFNGTPGNEEYHKQFEKDLTSLRQIFHQRFGIPKTDINIFYGPKSAGYSGVPTKEVFLKELQKASETTSGESAQPAWIILLGHANAIAGGAFYNLPGPDVNHRDIGKALEQAGKEKPLVIVSTMACSGKLLRSLRGPGRVIISATSPGDKRNETEFPKVLLQVLKSDQSDLNQDGLVSALEIFKACQQGVHRDYEKQGYIIQEHALLDGDGDGVGTARPAQNDALPASKVGLKLMTADSQKFD